MLRVTPSERNLSELGQRTPEGSPVGSPPRQRPSTRTPRAGLSSLLLVGFAALVTLVFVVGALAQSRFIMDLVRDLAIVF